MDDDPESFQISRHLPPVSWRDLTLILAGLALTWPAVWVALSLLDGALP